MIRFVPAKESITGGRAKSKRLFLWFSDRHDHSWRKELEIEGIDLGRGKRMLPKYAFS
jgi:hypothetical protein